MKNMTPATKHSHLYVAWEVKPIKVIQNPDYMGSAGDKAFLVQVCDCGKVQPRDYGPTEFMNDKLAVLV